MVGATEPASVGGVAVDAGATKGEALSVGTAAGWVVRATGPAGGGGGATSAGYRPMCARWRSTVASAAAVTASTICCREGGGSAPEAFTTLEFVAHGGRRWVTRGLNIRGGNGGVLLPFTLRSVKYIRGYLPSVSSYASGMLAGVTIRCAIEGGRLAFPRPLEGSSRRPCSVVVEESLAEEPVRSGRCFAAVSRRVSQTHCAPSRVPQADSTRSRRRRIALTTRSLRGVRSCVARSRARLSRHRSP